MATAGTGADRETGATAAMGSGVEGGSFRRLKSKNAVFGGLLNVARP